MNPIVNSRRSESYWLIPSLAHFSDFEEEPSVALCAFKCLGNCSMRIQNMAGAALLYHIGA
jgi:hypothetical protein